MSFLEKLGLSPKKSPNSINIGKKKKEKEQASTSRNSLYIRVGIISVFLLLLYVVIPQPSFEHQFDYQIEQPWMNEDLTAPFTFAILKSDEQLERERQTIRENTPPVYQRDNVEGRIQKALDAIFKQIETISQVYFQSSLDSDSSTVKKQQYIKQINAAGLSLSDKAWDTILSSQFNIGNLHRSLNQILKDVMADGITNRPKDQIDTKLITLRNLEDHTQQTINISSVRDAQQASQYAQYRLNQELKGASAIVGLEVFNRVITPNLIYQSDATQQRTEASMANLSTTKGAIGKGQIIIRTGDIVTQEKARILQSLAEVRSQNATDFEKWLKIGGDILIITSIFIIFFFYMYLYRRRIFKNNMLLLLVLLTLAVICIGSTLLFKFTDVPLLIVPIAIAPIILTIIFDSRLGILSTIALALVVGLIYNNNYEFVTATIVACSLGLFSVRDIRKRSQFFFTTPGIVFTAYAVVFVGFSMTAFQGWEPLLNKFLYAFLNTLFIVFTYPLILLVEKTFSITTDLTLIELGDTNLPLLNRLMTQAPGTFHHSLQVANLSETAAGAIRANSLLCRVGALYHDIGKTDHPEYFTENQTVVNELEKLKPRMSALVIKAHVSNGIKMAEEHNIPEVVIEFIKTHHGSSVIKFFYDKALQEADTEKDEIQIEDFRYDGPLPQTKETGIVMLADCVEAASRSMKNPNYQKLSNLVDKLVDERVKEGQLSETPLTFRDLHVIKKTFLNILVGIYHSRVEYPEDGKGTGDRSTVSKPHPKANDEKKRTPDKTIKGDKSAEESIDSYYNS